MGRISARIRTDTLRGHNGQLLEAEVVATFLPGEVVESLYSVMEAAGLEVAATAPLSSRPMLSLVTWVTSGNSSS